MHNVRASAVRPRQDDLATKDTRSCCSPRAATTRPKERAFMSSRRPRSRARVSDLLHSVGCLHHCAPKDGCAHSSHQVLSNSVVRLRTGPVREGEIPSPDQRGGGPFNRYQSQFLVQRASSGQAMVGTSSSIQHTAYLAMACVVLPSGQSRLIHIPAIFCGGSCTTTE